MGGYTGSHPIHPALGTWGWGVTQDPTPYILHWEHGGGGLHRIPSHTSCTGNMGVCFFTQDPTPYILPLMEGGGGGYFPQDPTSYIQHWIGGRGTLPRIPPWEHWRVCLTWDSSPYLKTCYGQPCWTDTWQWAFHWCDTATCTATSCHTHTCHYRHCGLGLVC